MLRWSIAHASPRSLRELRADELQQPLVTAIPNTHVLPPHHPRRFRPPRRLHCQLPLNTPSPAPAAPGSTRCPHCRTSANLQHIPNPLHAPPSHPVWLAMPHPQLLERFPGVSSCGPAVNTYGCGECFASVHWGSFMSDVRIHSRNVLQLRRRCGELEEASTKTAGGHEDLCDGTHLSPCTPSSLYQASPRQQ